MLWELGCISSDHQSVATVLMTLSAFEGYLNHITVFMKK